MQERLLYSIRETIDLLGIGRTKVYELIAQDILKITKIGRRTLVRASSIKALVEPEKVA